MNRRTFASQLIGTAGALVARQSPARSASTRCRVYFGTYTGLFRWSRGIYVADFDPATGSLGLPRLAARMRSPSYLTVSRSGQRVYAVGEGTNALHSFAVLPDGALQPINSAGCGGEGPCHVSIDKTGKVIAVANYGSGSLATFLIEPDGSVKGPVSEVQNAGHSVNPERQEGPHAHSVCFSPDNRFVLSCDLGMDKVFVHQLDARSGKLTPHGFATAPPGSGPRHLAFSKSGAHVLVNNEMMLTETVFDYDAARGALKRLETVSVLPDNVPFSKDYSTAETCMHPNGKWAYVSTRTYNSIARFRFDDATGKLVHLGNTPSGGEIPRDFNIDPSGRWLLAAHQDSNHVVVFKINPATGDLTPTGGRVRLGGGVCVKFAPVT